MARTQPHILREYAFLADGLRGAVVGPRGEIVWMCVPRWDSPAAFSALMGTRGAYSVTPSDPWFVWGGYYEDGSLIWRSRWAGGQGVVECREALALPSDPHRAVILRRIQALGSAAELTAVLDLRDDFGAQPARDVRLEADTWVGRSGRLRWRWSGAAAATVREEGLVLGLTVGAGERHDLVVEVSDRPLPDQPVNAERAWDATAHAWRSRVPRLVDVVGSRDARHSYAVLSGLTSPGGGMAAAATTSLPERARSGRDYDYRFSWIRDQCFAGHAAAVAGADDVLDSALEFVAERLLTDGPGLRPAYTVSGDPVPDVTELEEVPGYPGGGHVVGNRISDQFQLDAFGEALVLLAAGARADRLDTHHWRAVEIAVEAIGLRREDPDAGIWELEPRHWTHSRLTCAAGLRAIAAAAPASDSGDWSALADSLVAQSASTALHSSGRWQRSPEDSRVDAALLLPAMRGGVPVHDPRTIATLDAVLETLCQDGYVYRFRHDHRPLHEAEGAFLLCGFLTTLALHQLGRSVEARAFFERNRSACGPPGLFSEEYDVVQRQMRGNVPQAFVHAMMLEASARLAHPWPGDVA